MTNLMSKGRLALYKGIIMALVIGLLAIMLFPFFVMVVSMFKSSSEIYHSPPYWFPKQFTLKNFVTVWSVIPLANYFKSSLVISLVTMILNLGICIPAAYAVSRLRFPGKRAILFCFLVIQMFSPVIIVISLFKVVVLTGLVDTYLSLILANTIFTASFTIWMLNGYLSAIPVAIEDAAKIDGCNRFQVVVYVLLPIAVPGIVATAIYTFIYTWNEFLFALSFVQSTRKTPLTVGLFQFVGRFSVEWELLTGAACMALIPVLILFYLMEKRLVAGLTGGAIKG